MIEAKSMARFASIGAFGSLEDELDGQVVDLLDRT